MYYRYNAKTNQIEEVNPYQRQTIYKLDGVIEPVETAFNNIIHHEFETIKKSYDWDDTRKPEDGAILQESELDFPWQVYNHIEKVFEETTEYLVNRWNEQNYDMVTRQVARYKEAKEEREVYLHPELGVACSKYSLLPGTSKHLKPINIDRENPKSSLDPESRLTFKENSEQEEKWLFLLLCHLIEDNNKEQFDIIYRKFKEAGYKLTKH